MRRAGLCVALVLAVFVAPSPASANDQACLSDPVPPPTKPPHAVRFGITPLLAGTSGAVQEPPAPEDQAQSDAAVQSLTPPERQLVTRINSDIESDGQAMIDRAASLAQ